MDLINTPAIPLNTAYDGDVVLYYSNLFQTVRNVDFQTLQAVCPVYVAHV